MRALAVLLGVTLAAYAGAVQLLAPAIQADVALEKSVCNWLLMCANDVVLEEALAQLWSVEPGAAEAAANGFREALSRAPTDSNRWCDLGEALLRAGAVEEAEYCFNQAVRFAPHSPPILVRTAHFRDEIGQPENSLFLFRHVLELTRDYDPIVFGYFDRIGAPVDEVIKRAIPEIPEPLIAYFRHEVRSAGVDGLSVAWQEISERGLADADLLAEAVRRLVAAGDLDGAVETQVAFLGEGRGAWPERNKILNGGFESDFLDTELGWKISPRDGVRINRLEDDAHTGTSSLRIEFGGEENIDFRNVSQAFAAEAGRYRLSAAVRSEGLTTDQGVVLRVYDVKEPKRLDIRMEPVSGTTSWKRIETKFSVRGDTRLLRLGVSRRPSKMFDNKIAGSFWLDDVECVPDGR